MNIDIIRKYQKFYRSSEFLGSATILREYLGLEENFPIPLSISHGVDMNHTVEAFDVGCIEPIHWSYNHSIYERASTIKPSLILPHPWIILKSKKIIYKGSGKLIIGPPPGRHNDLSLYKCLKKMKLENCHILLKQRGDTKESKKFWEERGFCVVSAGVPDARFYYRLFDIINSYEFIIGCTLSSALFFASSLGKQCSLIDDYTYIAYETSDYLQVVRQSSLIATNFIKLLLSGDHVGATSIANEVLGDSFLSSPDILKKQLILVMENLSSPVYSYKQRYFWIEKFILCVSKLIGKYNLINYDVKIFFGKITNSQFVTLIKTNEIDVFLNGVNKSNFHAERIKYITNVTEPGFSAS